MKKKNHILFLTLATFAIVLMGNAQQNSNTILSANSPGSPCENNVLIGQDAGINLTTQVNSLNSNNVFVGFESGIKSNATSTDNTDSARNTFIGSFSGFENTIGSDNVFLGFGSGKLNTTGNENVFIKSLRENINNTGIPMTGNGNSMVGYRTGDFIQTGSNNSFFGNSAGRYTTTGNYNLFLGFNSGSSNLSGSQNICIGIGVNQAASVGNGNDNVYLGSYTAQNNDGFKNTFIGYRSGENMRTGTANTFLGYVQVPNTSSTTIMAGYNTNNSIILADGNGNQRMFIGQNGNTGIGLGNNVIPSNRLDINGGVVIGKNYVPSIFPTPTAGMVAPSNGLLVEGKVGVGNAFPKNKVEITQGTNGNSGLRFTNLTSNFTPLTGQTSSKFLTVNSTGDVILSTVTNSNISNTISSNENMMTSNVNNISSTAPIINSISNYVSNNQLVTLVNGVTSNPVTLPSNSIQTLSQSENTITLSNGGGSIVLPTFTDTDTDQQTLSLTGTTLSISNGNSVLLPITNVIAGNNISITGDGTTANPFQISSIDTSLYANNGSINQSTTTNNNRVVDMNNSNIWFNTSTSPNNGKIYLGSMPIFPNATGNYKLYVEGGILSEKVKVALRSSSNWADFVFENGYKLMPLKEVEKYILANKHLPGVDSANDLFKNGLDISVMQSKQMEKIEELTLYIIEKEKKIEAQDKAIEKNKMEIEELKLQVKALIEKTK